MAKCFAFAFSLLFYCSNALAGPIVNDLTITYDDDGWYQVQDAADYTTLCDGGDTCLVPAGQYIVINHSTGERWEGITVGLTDLPAPPDMVAGLSINGDTISWLDSGWYQVQSATDYLTVCEGGTSCQLPPGVYNVINHDTGERWNSIIIAAGGEEPVEPTPGEMPEPMSPGDQQPADPAIPGSPLVVEGLISWANDGWYQVQNASTYETLCEGGASCQVPLGETYILINLDSGQRWEGIEVGVAIDSPVIDPPVIDPPAIDPPVNDPTQPDPVQPDPVEPDPVEPVIPSGVAPVLQGTTLTLADDGWYQVQSLPDYSTICTGMLVCELTRGSYVVINHTTGQRWEDIAVYGTSGVWFGGNGYGDAVVVINPEGDVFSLSYDNAGFHEAAFGNLNDGRGQQRFLHVDSRNPLHGNSFSLNGELPSGFDQSSLDTVAYELSVSNDGQQLDNTGNAGEFALTYATTDDVGEIALADVAASWQARSAFCSNNCDVTLSINIGSNGFLQGSTGFNINPPISLAGAVSASSDSNQYLEVSFVWNSLEHQGVLYRDRNSERLILNATTQGGSSSGSFSAQLTRQ